MKLLILTENDSDFTTVLESCGVNIVKRIPDEALHTDLSQYDAFCILIPGGVLDVRLRERIEMENAKGKRVFTEALNSYQDVYSAPAVNTVRRRLIYIEPENSMGICGLKTGDLLDDESNLMIAPYIMMKDTELLLVYHEYIIAHEHTDMSPEDIRKDAVPGLWKCCSDTVMMTSFQLHNFNKARFAPEKAWKKLISYIAEWLTGNKPSYLPTSIVRYETCIDLKNEEIFEKCRRGAIDKGIRWLQQFLVDEGLGGIREGLQHDIDPDGNQMIAKTVRTDCSGECAGAFEMYARFSGSEEYLQIAENLKKIVLGPMVIKGGLFDGMMRWTETAWGVCYQDDVARAILPMLYDCVFGREDKYFGQIHRILDFLMRTTAKDGTRAARTDRVFLDEEKIAELAEAEIGYHSAHYNAYYLAALLLAYKYNQDPQFLEIGQRGLETLMKVYPETKKEHSDTQEMCRLILPLAILYDVTREERHLEMLYRVTNDLQKVRHSFGGYMEWDNGYTASCNRNSKGECSILTENGDPVADLLYSCNFLPLGFAYAYVATADELFYRLWHDIVEFFIRTQINSDYTLIDGSWCRAFDMNLCEAYAAPHDAGWATYSSETGWMSGEVLMGMMFLDLYGDKSDRKN